MKTRRILAASTAALLAFGTTAIVASAADLEVSEPSEFEDFSDVTAGELYEIADGVQIEITSAAQKKLEKYSIGATVGTAGTVADFFAMDSAETAVELQSNTVFDDLDSKPLKSLLKAVKTEPTSDDPSKKQLKDGGNGIQVFDIAVSYASGAGDETADSDIKLGAELTVKIKSSVKGTVYHVGNGGKSLEKVNATRTKGINDEDGYYFYTFKTNTFSPFVVADLSVSGISTMAAAAEVPGIVDSVDTSDAATSDGNTTTNPETGIALAIAPVVLAAGAVAVVALKKKH